MFTMIFHHLLIPGNPPLFASFCLACLRIIGVSGKKEQLAATEQAHTCSKPRRDKEDKQPTKD